MTNQSTFAQKVIVKVADILSFSGLNPSLLEGIEHTEDKWWSVKFDGIERFQILDESEFEENFNCDRIQADYILDVDGEEYFMIKQ